MGPRRAAAILLAALAIRGAFLCEWARTPYYRAPRVDARDNDRWALEIAGGKLLQDEAFHASPLYPYLVAGVYAAAGHRPGLVLVLQALLGALACLALALLAHACFGPTAGLLAGGMAALYRPFVFHGALLTKETLAVLTLALFALSAQRALEGGRRRDHLLAGLWLGLSAYNRGNALLMLPVPLLCAWLAGRRPRELLPGAGALLLGLGLALLPALAHNWAASRDFVLINYSGGFTFYISNGPGATGTLYYPPGVASDPQGEARDTRRIAEQALGRKLKPSEVASYWLRRGLAAVFEHPLAWLRLTWTKFRFFWNWYELPDNYNQQFIQAHFSRVLSLPFLGFGWIAPLGVLGWALFWRRGALPLLLGLAYMASVLAFFVSDRYRLPMAVFLLPFAAAALERLWAAALSREWRPLWKPLLAAAPLCALCWAPAPVEAARAQARSWGQLVLVCYDAQLDREALEAYRRGSVLPEALEPAAYVQASLASVRLGDLARAREIVEAGLRMHPGYAMLYNNAGVLRRRAEDEAAALPFFLRAVELDPGLGLAYRNLFLSCRRLGREAEARRYGEKALSLLPRDAELERMLREGGRR